jgi:mono/diheme cytochrome c family protein
MNPRRGIGCIVLVLAASAPIALAVAPQTTAGNPTLTIRSLAGGDVFKFYCATCHGGDGQGHGPVAAALKTPPPDLTRIARDHGGAFPRRYLESYVTNGDGALRRAAHGSSGMPVWGPVFRGLDASDTLVRIRIANVIDYIESIQEKQ